MSELTIKQIEQLKVIKDHKRITHSELVEITNLSKPTITEMINKFIKNGCAVKEKSPTDKRSYYVKLTDRGLKIAKSNELSLEKLIQKNAVQSHGRRDKNVYKTSQKDTLNGITWVIFMRYKDEIKRHKIKGCGSECCFKEWLSWCIRIKNCQGSGGISRYDLYLF